MPVSKGRFIDAHTAGKEVEEARRMVVAGDSSGAIPRLLHVISKYPESEAALGARYWLGVAYHEIRSYRESIELFREYLRLAPRGKLAGKATDYIAKLTEEYDKKFLSPEELDTQIKSVYEKLQADPGQLGYQLMLADLLWKRGNYPASGALYGQIVEKHPEYAKDATVSSRIEMRVGGGYTVLSPDEIQRREVERKPLMIMNTSSFRSGRDLLTRENKYYVVTGQVLNRGDSVLYGVQVFVTIYGFGNVVYDSTTVNTGRLNPGENRAFSVRFSNFENIENITRYECEGTFQR